MHDHMNLEVHDMHGHITDHPHQGEGQDTGMSGSEMQKDKFSFFNRSESIHAPDRLKTICA